MIEKDVGDKGVEKGGEVALGFGFGEVVVDMTCVMCQMSYVICQDWKKLRWCEFFLGRGLWFCGSGSLLVGECGVLRLLGASVTGYWVPVRAERRRKQRT